MKKLMLILTLLTTTLFSFQVDMWKDNNNAILNFNTFYDNVGGDEETNWVAIYRSGDSNDWDNVITWSWAKDLAHNEAGNYDERVLPLVTDEGSYEVRFFLNNSYDVFKSLSYSNGNGGGNNDASLEVSDKNKNSITFNSSTADHAWIGIYNKGDSNDWDNVKAWDWATSNTTSVDISNLDSGTYEARLFYNNSYNVEKTIEFTKDGGGNNEATLEIKSQTNSNITFNSTDADQAWIGIYNKGDSNDWDNVKTWDWVNNPTTIDISNLSQGTYEARLFYNNSYNVEQSVEFSLKNQSIKQKISSDIKNRYNLDNLEITQFIQVDDTKTILQWENDKSSIITYYKIENDNISVQGDLFSHISHYDDYHEEYNDLNLHIGYHDFRKNLKMTLNTAIFNANENKLFFDIGLSAHRDFASTLFTLHLDNYTPQVRTKEEISSTYFIDSDFDDPDYSLVKETGDYRIYLFKKTIKVINTKTGEMTRKDFDLKNDYDSGRNEDHYYYFEIEDNILNCYRRQERQLRLSFDISELPNIKLIKEY